MQILSLAVFQLISVQIILCLPILFAVYVDPYQCSVYTMSPFLSLLSLWYAQLLGGFLCRFSSSPLNTNKTIGIAIIITCYIIVLVM